MKMRQKHADKLIKYVTNNQLSKVRHIRRKHSLDLSKVVSENGNTLLHISYSDGYDDISRYLLKHGCNPMSRNSQGETPLHLACSFLACSGDKNKKDIDAYIEPLITICPECLDVKDENGKTPRSMLDTLYSTHLGCVEQDQEGSESDSFVIYVSDEEDSRDNDDYYRCKGKHSWHYNNSRLNDRLRKYIEENDLAGFRYAKEYKELDCSRVLLEGGNTLLHYACEYGQGAIVRYLLQEGCDPELVNEDGDLPLHRACLFAKESDDSYIYQDLVKPLIKACPKSVDVKNNRGICCRKLVGLIKDRAKKEEESEHEDDEEEFTRKLYEEMAAEYGEQWGHYEQEYANEDMGDWMDRMYKERKRKQKQPNGTTHGKKPKRSEDAGSSQGKRKKGISDEEKREFNRRMKEEYQREMKSKTREQKMALRLDYERKCQQIFKHKSSADSPGKKLGFQDIPWPHGNGENVENVPEFLFGGIDKENSSYLKCVKEQQVRWHPDRFLQKCGERLNPKERHKIMEKVKEISQILNSLMDK